MHGVCVVSCVAACLGALVSLDVVYFQMVFWGDVVCHVQFHALVRIVVGQCRRSILIFSAHGVPFHDAEEAHLLALVHGLHKAVHAAVSVASESHVSIGSILSPHEIYVYDLLQPAASLHHFRVVADLYLVNLVSSESVEQSLLVESVFHVVYADGYLSIHSCESLVSYHVPSVQRDDVWTCEQDVVKSLIAIEVHILHVDDVSVALLCDRLSLRVAHSAV